MERDEELSDLELIHEVMAHSVRQRSLLSLVERRCAHRELDAQLRREARARKKKGDPVTPESPEGQDAA
jgi:hypothetical protein